MRAHRYTEIYVIKADPAVFIAWLKSCERINSKLRLATSVVRSKEASPVRLLTIY